MQESQKIVLQLMRKNYTREIMGLFSNFLRRATFLENKKKYPQKGLYF